MQSEVTEVRRRALRAAMAVTLSVVALGCATTVDEPNRRTKASTEARADTTGSAGGSDTTGSAGGSDTTGSAGGSDTTGSAGGQVASTGGAGGAGGGSGQVDCRALSNGGQDWDAYTKCCDAQNWDFKAGCEAWGPPMPPSMEWMPTGVA